MKKLMLLFIAIFVISCEKEQNINDPVDGWNPIDHIELEYFIDNADYKLDNKNPSSTDIIEGVEFVGAFSSVAGSNNQNEQYYNVNLEGNEVLGKTLDGYMDFDFTKSSGKEVLDIDLDITVEYTSFIVGAVKQKYEFEAFNVPLDTHYIDNSTQLHVSEFVKRGENACDNIDHLTFSEDNEQYTSTLLNYDCNSRAEIKIKVFYESYK